MSTNHPGVIIGLTGGIATGKSTVSRFFRDHGVVVIDADELARDIVAPGSPALVEIVETFGEEVLHQDGTLHRTALAEIIFPDPQARRALESITHPRIAQEMLHRAGLAFQNGHRWVLYDAALLVETGTHRFLDALIVVDASPETQRRRLRDRDQLSDEEIDQRLAAQLPLKEKKAGADFIIDNNGSLDETAREVEALRTKIDRLVETYGTAKPKRGEDD